MVSTILGESNVTVIMATADLNTCVDPVQQLQTSTTLLEVITVHQNLFQKLHVLYPGK